jgi:hypothetical protein
MSVDSKICCVHCGKGYKNRTNMNKHLVLCELVHKSKRKKQLLIEEEEDNNLPSQKQMYKMLLELAFKYNTLEEKMELAMKWIDKKKKKINVVEWLQTNLKPDCIFDNLSDKVIIINSDIEFLFNNSFIDTLNEAFSRVLYTSDKSDDESNIVPLFAFVQKANVIYTYNTNESSVEPIWVELSKVKLIYFLNKIHFKFVKKLSEWKKTNQALIDESESSLDLYNKTLIKLMGIDFKQESLLSKIRTNMYNKMKTDMKALIEYEFEF